MKQHHSRRWGGISPLLVFAVGVLIAATALAVDASNLWQARVELRNGADAACLACAQALLDDELLTNKPGIMSSVAYRAREEAIRYGWDHPALGEPLELEDNPDNDVEGDIVFGYIVDPATRQFQPTDDLDDPHLNAVRVVARRTRERGNPAGMFFARFFNFNAADVVTTATVYLDRDVIGFRPLRSQPIPVVPLALLTDPSMANPEAWETQTIKPTLVPNAESQDEFAYDRQNRRFLQAPKETPQGDGIYEMHVHLPLAGQAQSKEKKDEPNGCFICIGGQDWDCIRKQIVNGIAPDELRELDGQLVLGEDNRLLLPGIPTAPSQDSIDLGLLLDALEQLQELGEPRVWPLFSTTQTGDDGQVTVVLQGFVAARLIDFAVETVEIQSPDGKEKQQRQELSLRLQPCQMSTGSAVTDHRRRTANSEVDIHNRYISKVRLVE